ncbi:MAG: hypothetical protein AAF125_06600 [Chloroflexota bacterium]
MQISEERINNQVAAAETPDDINNLTIDLIPGGLIVQGDIAQRGAAPTVPLIVTTILNVENNAIVITATNINVGGNDAPLPVVNRINAEVVPTISDSINAAIEEEVPFIAIESITVTDTAMTVTVTPG